MAVTVIRFEPYKEEEDIEQYFERLEMFLMADAVEEESRPRVKWDWSHSLFGVAKLVGTDKPERQQFVNHKTETDSAL